MFLDALALIIRQARGQWERWGGFSALQKKPNMSPQTCDNGTCQQRLAAEDDSRVHSALNVHVIKCYSFGSRIFSLPLLQLWGLWKRHNSRYCSWHAAIRKDCQFFFFFPPFVSWWAPHRTAGLETIGVLSARGRWEMCFRSSPGCVWNQRSFCMYIYILTPTQLNGFIVGVSW